MKSFFYMRTAYRLFMDQLPQCFVDLDNVLAPSLVTADEQFLHPAVRQGERLCRRMAGVDFYAVELAKVMGEDNEGDAAIEAEILLVGYMSSCKAVLDAAAIVLTQLFALGLSSKQQDLRLPRFRSTFKGKNADAAARYSGWDTLIDREIVPWRDAVIHRETPIVVPRGAGLPFQGLHASPIAQALDPDADAAQLLHNPESFVWVDPLHFHRRWRSSLVALCDEVCSNVRASAGVAGSTVSSPQ